MGTVVQLKNQINDSYFQLKDSVEEKLVLTEEKIKSKLSSDVQLVQKMTDYHIETGGKRHWVVQNYAVTLKALEI